MRGLALVGLWLAVIGASAAPKEAEVDPFDLSERNARRAAEQLQEAVAPTDGEAQEPVAPVDEGKQPEARGPEITTPCEGASSWPLWSRYLERFAQDDGRIVDRTDGDKSTSEGQAYGLFFALVANDRPRFEKILAWANANLAKGDLGGELPAWKWGRHEDGGWKVLDPNAASDADLWMGYVLLEAARIWDHPAYDALGRKILARVLEHETLEVRGLGRVILPGPHGFVLEKGKVVRLNPSYLPPQLFRRFISAGVAGPWKEILASSEAIIRKTSPKGRAADWVVHHSAKGFGVDPVTGPLGSYDAIRVYLWTTTLSPADPLREALIRATSGLYDHWKRYGFVPERLDVRDLEPGTRGAPPGFLAVLIADVEGRGDADAARELEAMLARTWFAGLYGDPPAYYDHNLLLFARGYVERRYSFAADGSLELLWMEACKSP